MPADGMAEGTRALARGERLFRQGDRVSAIYAVERGELRLERRTYDGRLVVLHTARAGEFFAEAALFAEAYHCDAVAIVPSQVRIYPKAALLDTLRSDAATAFSFVALLARQLQAVRQRLEWRDVRSAQDRMMLYLELKAGPDGAVRLDRPLQDIAAELGLTREALYRSLAALRRGGAIERAGRQIRIKRPLGA